MDLYNAPYFPERAERERLEERVRDLELVCQTYHKTLEFMLVRWMKAGDTRDLKEKIWPSMDAAKMVLSDAS